MSSVYGETHYVENMLKLRHPRVGCELHISPVLTIIMRIYIYIFFFAHDVEANTQVKLYIQIYVDPQLLNLMVLHADHTKF